MSIEIACRRTKQSYYFISHLVKKKKKLNKLYFYFDTFCRNFLILNFYIQNVIHSRSTEIRMLLSLWILTIEGFSFVL